MARKAQAASSFPGSHQLGYDHATDWRRRLSVVTCPAFPFQGSLAQSGPRGEPATAPTLDPGAPGDSPGLLFRGVAARAPAPHWRWPVKTPVRLLAAGGGSRRSPALFGCRRGPVELHPRLPPRRFIYPLHANPHLTLPTPRPLPLPFPFSPTYVNFDGRPQIHFRHVCGGCEMDAAAGLGDGAAGRQLAGPAARAGSVLLGIGIGLGAGLAAPRRLPGVGHDPRSRRCKSRHPPALFGAATQMHLLMLTLAQSHTAPRSWATWGTADLFCLIACVTPTKF